MPNSQGKGEIATPQSTHATFTVVEGAWISHAGLLVDRHVEVFKPERVRVVLSTKGATSYQHGIIKRQPSRIDV